MPCRFASSGTVATSRSASRAILALNAASNFLRDLVISVLRRLRQSRTLHTLTFGPISGVHFRTLAISHARPLEANRVINRDRCRDGRLALALVQGSGTSTRILTAPHLLQSQSTIRTTGPPKLRLGAF